MYLFKGSPFRFCFFAFFFILIHFCAPSHAGFLDSAMETVKAIGEQQGIIQKDDDNGTLDLSQGEVIKAFKEALDLGAQRAVEAASRPGGFLDNPTIRIPFPGRLSQVASVLKSMGMAGQVTAFEETMNRAAEKAAIKALPIFKDAVKEMTFDDVKGLLYGGDTAITGYFRKKTWDKLYQNFIPVVHETIQSVGVTQTYQAIVSQPAISQMVANTDFDLDHYVSTQALQGLFTLLGQEEKRIREKPVARSTELLKKVFGK